MSPGKARPGHPSPGQPSSQPTCVGGGHHELLSWTPQKASPQGRRSPPGRGPGGRDRAQNASVKTYSLNICRALTAFGVSPNMPGVRPARSQARHVVIIVLIVIGIVIVIAVGCVTIIIFCYLDCDWYWYLDWLLQSSLILLLLSLLLLLLRINLLQS